jgi:succinate dehydrogenase / fumarate reductase flavoprotein subunit
MYHQFMELGGIDITREPMEVGPTTHYIMGGVRVDAETQMSRVPGLFACGECAVGINGANRLGGNSLSDLIVFGKRAGEFAGKYVKDHPAPQVRADEVEGAARWALAPFERQAGTEGPYQVQQDLQEMMQDQVGIVRREEEMQRALDRLARLRDRAAKARVTGNREYNPGWHTALDLHCLLTVAEAITRCALQRKESRGGHFRDDYPNKVERWGKVNLVACKGADGRMEVEEVPIPPLPAELQQIIQENK